MANPSRWPIKLAVILFCLQSAFGQWHAQQSGTDVQLRGVSAVSSRVAWASGTKGTVLRTVDGGKHWVQVNVAGAEKLDFRDVEAFDEQTAFVLSIGPGEQSRIYKTSDGGRNWQLEFTNHEPKAFYDCFAFWDRTHGIALSDSVDGQFLLLSTSDGKSWAPLHPKQLPAALKDEGAFAASGSCLTTFGKNDVWFATGGPAARVFHSSDRGQTWTVAETPILSGQPSQGIFSIAFWSRNDGVIVGGDYKDPTRAEKNAAFTTDGGRTWTLATKLPGGYRSGVARRKDWSPPILAAVGINGIDFSVDGGRNWFPVTSSPGELNSVSFSPNSDGWLVGPAGRVILDTKPPKM